MSIKHNYYYFKNCNYYLALRSTNSSSTSTTSTTTRTTTRTTTSSSSCSCPYYHPPLLLLLLLLCGSWRSPGVEHGSQLRRDALHHHHLPVLHQAELPHKEHEVLERRVQVRGRPDALQAPEVLGIYDGVHAEQPSEQLPHSAREGTGERNVCPL